MPRRPEQRRQVNKGRHWICNLKFMIREIIGECVELANLNIQNMASTLVKIAGIK